MAYFAEHTATTLQELVNALHAARKDHKTLWFRGQSDSSWKLVPSIGRPPYDPTQESNITKRFKQNAIALLDGVQPDDWHWMFLMQHHRAPTRLLDWSENPLVATFFATELGTEPEKDGCVWCLDPVALNKATHGVEGYHEAELPFFGVDDEFSAYLLEQLGNGTNKRRPLAALAPRYFPRLTAQSGVFTITHREQTPIETISEGACVGRIILPAATKPGFREDLASLGMTRLTLFPELDEVGAYAKRIT